MSSKTPKSILRWSVTCFVVSVIVFLFISLLLFLIFISARSKDRSSTSLHHYQYFEINVQSNETHQGKVTLNKKLGKDEYISYRNKRSGNYAVISPFGGSQYQCDGSCHCDSNSRRSASVQTLTRSFFFIISALSATVATRIAREAMHNKCAIQMSGKCEEDKIVAKILKCYGIIEKEEDFSNWREYDCHGYCVPNLRIKSQDGVQKQKRTDCKEYEMSGRVGFFVDEPGEFRNTCMKAKSNFVRDHLMGFCKQKSSVMYWYYTHTKGGRRIRRRRKAAMCISNGRGKYRHDYYKYDNIHCYQVDKNNRNGRGKVAEYDRRKNGIGHLNR